MKEVLNDSTQGGKLTFGAFVNLTPFVGFRLVNSVIACDFRKNSGVLSINSWNEPAPQGS